MNFRKVNIYANNISVINYCSKFNLLFTMKKYLFLLLFLVSSDLLFAQLFAPEIKVQSITGNGIGIKLLPDANSDLHIKDSRASLYIENTNSSNWSFLRIKGSGSNFFDIAQYGDNDFLEFRPMGSSTNRMILKKDGTLIARTYQAINPPWSDFVFEENYNLKSLEELETYISQNKHLPDIPTEVQVKEKGINLGEMNAKLLQKIEELTLYVIEQSKRNYIQQSQIEVLKNRIVTLENKLY